jgi:SAM-dependent methyltransferase
LQPQSASSPKDHLWLHIRDLPYFRGLLRAVEARFYEQVLLPEPVLDLGCGDGHFAATTFDHPLDVGLDPWTGPLKEAVRRGGYRLVVQGFGDRLPFADQSFSSAVSNSVLEHIADLDPVLEETARVLKPGAPFIFCVPNHNFLPNLSIARGFDRLGLVFAAKSYRNFFNRISRHHNCDDENIWLNRLEKVGFSLERKWHYFSPKALAVLEWGHYFGLPSLVVKALFKRWLLVPAKWNLALTRHICQPIYNEPAEQVYGAYSFYISRRIG